MHHRFLIRSVVAPLTWLLLAIGMPLPSQLFAQGYELRVTLRDVGGRGLAGITIMVRDETGQDLARMVSDSSGAARFADLPAIVRVAVDGQARGGPRLFQLGDDAQGIRIMLDKGDELTTLDLRVERDGLVLPDPATMLTLEEGGPVAPDAFLIPTALLATPAPLPTTIAVAGAVHVDQPPPPAERRNNWVPLISVLIVVVAAGLMALIQRRRSAL